MANIVGSGLEISQSYLSDAVYPPGTVVKPAGNNPYEITMCVSPYCTQPIGVVSTNPGVTAGLDNPGQGGATIAITTVGKTYALVQGPAFVGDKLVAGNIPGTLMSLEQNPPTPISGVTNFPTVIGICMDTNSTNSPLSILVTLKSGTPNPAGNVIVNNITNIGTSTVGSIVTTGGVTWPNNVPYSAPAVYNTMNFVGSTTQLSSMFTNSGEIVTVSNASVSGTVPYYVSSQNILYYQGTSAGNFVLNVLGSNVQSYSGTAVNAQGTINNYTMTIGEVAGAGSIQVGAKIVANGYTINGATYAPTFANTTVKSQTSGSTGTAGVYLLDNWAYLPAQSAIYAYNPTSATGTTLDQILQPGQSVSIAFINTNGSTGYYLTGLQIDGINQTIRWINGSTPGAGSANALDVYNFTIIKTYATQIVTPPTRIPVYTVLGSVSRFG
jgi:hypothetical protein